MNSNIRNAILILLAIVLIGGVGFGVYIYNNKSNTVANLGQNQQTWGGTEQGNPRGNVPNGQGGPRGGMGMDFSQFVNDGIIDQTTADKMKTYMEEQMKNMQPNRQNDANRGGMDLFSGMVSAGIITQEQADKMQEAMPQMGGTPPQSR